MSDPAKALIDWVKRARDFRSCRSHVDNWKRTLQPVARAEGGRVYNGPWPSCPVFDSEGKPIGHLVYDAESDSIGAHCGVVGHGTCRANRLCKRLPIGYLVVWLKAGSGRTGPAHRGLRGFMIGADMGFDARERARRMVEGQEHMNTFMSYEDNWRTELSPHEPP